MKIRTRAWAALCAASLVSFSAHAANDRVLIYYKAGKADRVEKLLSSGRANVHTRFRDFNTVAATVTPALLRQLRADPAVELVELDAVRKPFGQTVPYGIDLIGARQVWDKNFDGVVDTGAPAGAGTKVCIIDSGIAAGHPDFAGVTLLGGYPSDWNTDTCSHGTHVAGTITAQNNGIGVVGVSPGKLSLYIVKVFDGEACAWSNASTLSAAALRCQQAGAKVINMSLGGGRPTKIEEKVFASVLAKGTLPIAAAGNDGTTTLNYPASYASVMSVAAVDETMTVADFSQKNAEVEVAAPGVHVLSTVSYNIIGSINAGGTAYAAIGMTGSLLGSATAPLVNGGLCTTVGAWTGKTVLCQRGTNSFAEKAANALAGGGKSVIIYNNVDGSFSGTLGDAPPAIIAVSASLADGQKMVASSIGKSTTVSVVKEQYGYAYYDGTSMATPHVTAAAALLFNSKSSATPAQVRSALTSTALDEGTPGKDDAYGYGVIQLPAAISKLATTP